MDPVADLLLARKWIGFVNPHLALPCSVILYCSESGHSEKQLKLIWFEINFPASGQALFRSPHRVQLHAGREAPDDRHGRVLEVQDDPPRLQVLL